MAKRRKFSAPVNGDRCQNSKVCQSSPVTGLERALLAEKMRCSHALYNDWSKRSDESLSAYERSLFKKPPVPLAYAPRRNLEMRPFNVPALQLFRERTCHLRASYFCNWQPDSARLAAFDEAEQRKHVRQRRQRQAGAEARRSKGKVKRSAKDPPPKLMELEPRAGAEVDAATANPAPRSIRGDDG
eukprot:CAMPEP_0179878810 /NCGR_PEP_ID=MMETSP0982-20121206/25682_1 /TAXON_ID=483367 /ORGANISM="non described non described, Strain CCMP 2436" /LENGTH=185 /DNA_ID=CAMNT_0021771821 /DNA_START=279 /DNA_END=836 /DNA_ORIENTATION=+